MTTSGQNKRALTRVARGADRLLPIVVYRKGAKESLEAPEPEDVLVRPKEMKNLEITITNTECGRTSKPTDVCIDGGQIKVELSGELTKELGKGIYRLDLTYDEPNSHYADGMRHIALAKECCNVVDPKDATEPMAAELRLEVRDMLQGEKGDPGLSVYDWAVEQGLCSTPEQFVEVFRGATGLSAYELYLVSTSDSPKKSLTEWLYSIGGKDGKSVYDLALDDGFVGDLHAFLLSIHGRDGKDAYQHYLDTTTDNPKKSVEEWLESNKGEKGDSAYQSYLKTTDDTTKMTEKQWANANDFFYQFLFRILKGAGVQPTETDMTADQVFELDRQRREIAQALRSYGVEVQDTDGLEKFAEIIKGGVIPTLTLYKSDQFYQCKDRTLPPMKIWGGWVSPALSGTFSRAPDLIRLPNIDGMSYVVSIYNICMGSPNISGAVSVPNMPKCISAQGAFYGCSKLESAEIGDMPECTTIYDMFRDCKSLVRATLGSCPKNKNIQNLFANCTNLEEVAIGDTGAASGGWIFYKCAKLRRINGVIDLSMTTANLDTIFFECRSLEEVRVKGVNDSISLQWCAGLSLESVRYLVDNAQTVTGKSITLHSALLDKWEDELTEMGESASQKGWAINYR